MIDKEKSLAYRFPELAKERHPTKMAHYYQVKFSPVLIKKCGGNALKGMSGKLLFTVETMVLIVRFAQERRCKSD